MGDFAIHDREWQGEGGPIPGSLFGVPAAARAEGRPAAEEAPMDGPANQARMASSRPLMRRFPLHPE